MAFQSVPETAEVNILYTQNGETVQMTAHARFAGGYGQAELDALAANVDAVVGSSFLPIQTQDVNYVATEVRGLEFENDQVSSANTNAGPGQVASGGLPNQNTIAIKRTSGFTGRSARGRIYWIGLSIADLTADENFISLGSNTAIVNAVAALRSNLGIGGWAPVIVSRWSGGVKRPTGVTFNWVATSNTDLRLDSQRGRMP